VNWPVRILEPWGCWVWEGRLDRDGYGRERGRLAHVVVYEQEFGPVPQGMALDHRCRRRDCVNPRHLEPVTKSENERRKSWGARLRRPLCKAGHEASTNAMVTPEGGRLCRRCDR
jgi:HNH endonuclease